MAWQVALVLDANGEAPYLIVLGNVTSENEGLRQCAEVVAGCPIGV
jgi:hypothetical protein